MSVTVRGSDILFNDGTTQSTAASNWQSSSSLTGNGQQTFSNGLRIQWGSQSLGANTRTTFNFPVSFGTAFSITSGSDWGPTGSGGWAVAGATLVSASQFILWNAGDNTNTVYWIAIGTW